MTQTGKYGLNQRRLNLNWLLQLREKMLESSLVVHRNCSFDVQKQSEKPAKRGDVIRKSSQKRGRGHLLPAV